MFRKAKLKIASIFLVWIFVCLVFGAVAEEWAVKESLNVTVGDSETEIMESTLTDKKFNRKFDIYNGENEIIATAWGSNDQVTWEAMCTITLSPYENNWLILGHNHWWYVKLTGRTTNPPNTICIVDAYLYYRVP